MSLTSLSTDFNSHLDRLTNSQRPQPLAASGGAKVTARMENLTPGECPYCKKAMSLTTCCGQSVFYCADDRAVLPRPNDQLSVALY